MPLFDYNVRLYVVAFDMKTSALGFENGGSFTVGSRTGIAPLTGNDNRLVAFRAKDGEDVTITPKGQSKDSGMTINNYVTIQATDVNSFRNSSGQISAQIARAVQAGARNL